MAALENCKRHAISTSPKRRSRHFYKPMDLFRRKYFLLHPAPINRPTRIFALAACHICNAYLPAAGRRRRITAAPCRRLNAPSSFSASSLLCVSASLREILNNSIMPQHDSIFLPLAKIALPLTRNDRCLTRRRRGTEAARGQHASHRAAGYRRRLVCLSPS